MQQHVTTLLPANFALSDGVSARNFSVTSRNVIPWTTHRVSPPTTRRVLIHDMRPPRSREVQQAPLPQTPPNFIPATEVRIAGSAYRHPHDTIRSIRRGEGLLNQSFCFRLLSITLSPSFCLRLTFSVPGSITLSLSTSPSVTLFPPICSVFLTYQPVSVFLTPFPLYLPLQSPTLSPIPVSLLLSLIQSTLLYQRPSKNRSKSTCAKMTRSATSITKKRQDEAYEWSARGSAEKARIIRLPHAQETPYKQDA